MTSASRTTVRHAGLLTAQRGSQLLAGALFAFLVPRAMGPETFGRYGLVTSIAMWFMLFSGMGAAQTMGRFVPGFIQSGDREGLRDFLKSFLTLRLLGGFAAAGSYFAIGVVWFPELDPAVLGLVAGCVLASALSKPLFSLFLGLNLAARWGLGETVRLWLNLVFLLIGWHLAGLRGACAGMLGAELAVLAIGWRSAAPHLAGGRWRYDRRRMRPYLRFGTLVFLTSVLLVTSQRSGELLARAISSDYSEIGVFGAANRIYQVVWLAVWQTTMAFSPLLVTLREEGRSADVARWIERLLKGSTLAAIGAVYAVWLTGADWVPVLFGASYRDMPPILLVLTVAIVALALGAQARILALVYDRQATALAAAAIQCAVFWSIGYLLAPLGAGAAAAWALLASVSASSAFLAWRMRRVSPLRLAPWARGLALGAAFLPLGWIRSPDSAVWNAFLYLIFATGFTALAFKLRLVTLEEIRALRRALRRRPLAEPGPDAGAVP